MQSEDEQKALEDEFLESWDGMEGYFSGLSSKEGWDGIRPILGLIGELRKRGYDRQFRAGQSMSAFVLSRSRMYGLRRGKPWFRFILNKNAGMLVSYSENDNLVAEFTVKRVEITPEIEALLERLLAQPID